MKLVVNMIMGSMMASFSEGLVLGKKVGLDPATIVEVLKTTVVIANADSQNPDISHSLKCKAFW
jgi:3-hydroxyisobutyrate dehydrogenase-like beta-hydroxyacid dehydrogenase